MTIGLSPAQVFDIAQPEVRYLGAVRSNLEVAVLRMGRAMARADGRGFVAAFDESYESDLRRHRVFRALRRPWLVSSERIWEVIDHLLRWHADGCDCSGCETEDEP